MTPQRQRMNVVGPSLQRAPECEAILRTLPMWFGIEDALQMYVRDSATLPTFGAEEDGSLVGFLSLQEHFPRAWEVHCIAVRANHRGRGIGSHLLAHSEAWLARQGVRFLQIKTVADTSPSREYAETREFYRARGYAPLEVFPTLWNPRNPALQLVKVLTVPALRLADEDILELTRLEEAMWREETRFDMAFMERHLAPDFFEYGRSGRTYTREQSLAVPRGEVQAKLPLPGLSIRPIDVDTVQITYCSAVTYDGVTEHGRRSSLWSRGPNGWVMRFHQGTPHEP